MTDYISRADAICEVLVNDGIDNIVGRINALPSADRPSVEIKECRPLCTEQKIAVEEFLNAPRMSEKCAIELLQMTGWLQEHDKEIGRPSGEWLMFDGLYCSNCHYKLQTTGIPTYCPSCGAKMKGGAE